MKIKPRKYALSCDFQINDIEITHENQEKVRRWQIIYIRLVLGFAFAFILFGNDRLRVGSRVFAEQSFDGESLHYN